MSEIIYHHGVKGMKWGVRKKVDQATQALRNINKKESAYRSKLTNIQKNKNAHASDLDIIKKRNQPLIKRASKTVAANVANVAIREFLSGGKITKLASMNKGEIIKEVTSLGLKVARNSAISMGLQEAMARSVASKYNDNGKRKKTVKKENLLTREDLANIAIETSLNVGTFLSVVGKMKYQQAKANRYRNEQRFRSWGSRILEEGRNLGDIVFSSDDGSYNILNRRT